MKKLLALAVVSALLITACGGPGTTAVNVNGTRITVGDVDALNYRADGAEPLEKRAFANDLTFLIEYRIVLADAAEELGIEATEAEIAAEELVIVEANQTEGESREAMLQRFGRTEAFLNKVAHLSVLHQKVIDHYKPEMTAPTEIEIEEALPRLIEVCASHILFAEADEEKAREVLDDILGGADFAGMAEEHGTDGTAADGGDLGCAPPAQYVAEFRVAVLEAPVGEVMDELVQTEFGWHIVKVTERTVPTTEESIEQLTEEAAFARFQQWRIGQMAAAEVEVSPRFGTWATTPSPGVVPPA